MRQLKLYPDPEVKTEVRASPFASARASSRVVPARVVDVRDAPPATFSVSCRRRRSPVPPLIAPHPRPPPFSQRAAPAAPVEKTWNSARNTEVKRLLRPGVADGPAELAANMTKAGAISVNLQPLTADEMAVLGDGLKRAESMTVIRLKCEARGGGLPIAAPERLKTRKMTSASGRDALRADKTRERLARCLAAQVRRSTTLVELELGADLGPAAMEILGKAIAGNVSLRRLSFADSNLGDTSFASLTHGLRENNAVREINLSGCALTDASGTAVGSILRAHASRRATVSWENTLRCYPGSAAEKDHAARRPAAGGLTKLDLSYNRLAVVAVRAICESLRQDDRLETLVMKNNHMNEDCAAKLGRAMREHPTLASIELQASEAEGANLGILRVVPGSDDAEEKSATGEDEDGAKAVERRVFMDMDCPPTTPRSRAKADTERAATRAEAAARAKAESRSRPSSARAAGTRAKPSGAWAESRRGWSPASNAVPPKWDDIGSHTAAARPASALPRSPFAKAARPASVKRDARRSEPWTAPKLGRSKAEAVLATKTNTVATREKASTEKMLVNQLTKALRALEDRVAGMSADELRRHVAMAARAADTASTLTETDGRASSRMIAKVREDLRALEEMCD